MKKNEISSTEKLLNLIKGQDQHDPETSAGPQPGSPSGRSAGRKKTRLPRVLALKENTTVGVDIGPTWIKLTKVARYSGGNRRLLDIRTVPLDRDLPRTGAEFSGLLRKTLSDFCGPSQKTDIWTTISSLNVEARLLSLPVVPGDMLANSVRLTFRKEVPFDEKEMIFDYAYQGEITEGGIKKMSILAFIAPREEVNAVRDLFAGSGYPLTGITIISLALQNLHRAGSANTEQKPECYLFIGSDWSRIDLYDRGALALTRDIKTGMNSMIEDIMDGIQRELLHRDAQTEGENDSRVPPAEDAENSTAGDFPGSPDREGDDTDYPADTDSMFVLDLESSVDTSAEEESGLEAEKETQEEITFEGARKVLENQFEDGPALSGDDPGYGISAETIFGFIKPSIDRLIRQVERTISHYTSTFQGSYPDRLYFTGSLGTYEKLVDYTGDHLGITSSCLDPFTFPTRNMVDVPPSLAERQSYAPAVGLGLSDLRHTPNFLFTQQDKGDLDRLARKDRIVFAVFLALIVTCFGGYTWQNHVLNKEKQRLESLQQELNRYQPETGKPILTEMAAGISRKQRQWKNYQERYRSLALISELSSLTPPGITYQSCNIVLDKPGSGKNAGEKMILDGRLQGGIQRLESSLAGFLVKLADSPLFDRPRIESSNIKADETAAAGNGKGTLRFRIRLDII